MKIQKPEAGLFISLGTVLLITWSSTGCMQLTGAKRINAWGLEIESNAGFEVSAGAMQYDGADNQKTMNRNAGRGK